LPKTKSTHETRQYNQLQYLRYSVKLTRFQYNITPNYNSPCYK